MYKKVFIRAIFLFFFNQMNAQFPYVNQRTSLGYLSTVFTGIFPTDSCIYLKGEMINDKFEDGIFWAKADSSGDIYHLEEILTPNKEIDAFSSKILLNNHGNFVFGGIAKDSLRKGFIIELDSDGQILRYKEFLSPLYPAHPFIYVSSVQLLSNGEYAVSGNLTNVTKENTLFAKLDADFNMKLSKAYGTTQLYETNYSMAVDTKNNILLGGWESRQSIEKDIISRKQIIQLDSTGENALQYIKWPEEDLPKWRGWSVYDMLIEPDGSIIGASAITEEIPMSNPMYADLWNYPTVFKLNPDYSLAWETRIHFGDLTSTGQNVRMVRANDGGGYVAAGEIGVSWIGFLGLITKVDKEGKIVWKRTLSFYSDTTANGYFHTTHDFAAAPNSGYWLCGEITRNVPNEPLQQGWLVRVDDYGCLSPGCHLVGTEYTPTLEDNITVYPNPASEYIVVHHAGHEFLKGRFRIVDMQGRTIQDWAAVVNDMSTVFDVSSYPSGNYVLQYSEGGQVMVARQFVVSR